jgi:hypothetical protein
MREEGRGKREEGRGKKEEGRGKRMTSCEVSLGC